MKLTNILFFFVERVMLQLADNEVHRAGNPSLFTFKQPQQPMGRIQPQIYGSNMQSLQLKA
jgi:hypothetical protein